MTTVRDLHSQAMQLAQLAMVARHEGDTERAQDLARRAYNLEAEAAVLVPEEEASEPTLSILHRSAASLAYQCGEYELAQRQIAKGLSGHPPPEIKRELKTLFRDIDFQLLLHERGVRLDDAELELLLEGDAVGPGTVFYSEFIDRLQATYTQLNRTVQRLMKKDYQDRGRVADLYKPFTTVLSAPKAASFSVSIKLASPEDKEPLLFPQAAEVIHAVVEGTELVNAGDEAALRKLIPEPLYYRAFVLTARDMAPDGERISAVRFIAESRTASLTNLPSELVPAPALEAPEEGPRREPIAVEGILDYASSRKGQVIGLTTEDGRTYNIAVEEGIDDVVRSYYGRRVAVTGLYDLESKQIIPEGIRGLRE